jgi:tRNA-splicing ligase RtcB
MRVYNCENGKTILSWCENPEESAIEQAFNLSTLPFVDNPICLMPDTHFGYGMPIGGVIACDGSIVPNAVGVDIGCGMLACKTDINYLETDVLKSILGEIRKKIPVGFSHHQKANVEMMPKIDVGDRKVIGIEYESATHQVGTLGGGNHFIEIQKGIDNHIWFMLHSGSRNIGLKVAKYYNDIAKELNEKWHSVVTGSVDLAFLPIDSKEGKEYISEMEYCLDFAQANRNFMSEIIMGIMYEKTGCGFIETHNIHHNYAALENHNGKNRWIHRKGATSARLGEIGIIPGSQGTSSYIVRGLGNEKSYTSCSHGAGRRMGRKQAVRELSLENETKKMEEKGILHALRGKEDLDEAAGAYKDIDVVMSEQKDLVEIVVKLEPLAVVKG